MLCPQADLARAREQLDGQGADLDEWRAAVAAKDLEIQNLQVVTCPARFVPHSSIHARLSWIAAWVKVRQGILFVVTKFVIQANI